MVEHLYQSRVIIQHQTTILRSNVLCNNVHWSLPRISKNGEIPCVIVSKFDLQMSESQKCSERKSDVYHYHFLHAVILLVFVFFTEQIRSPS